MEGIYKREVREFKSLKEKKDRDEDNSPIQRPDIDYIMSISREELLARYYYSAEK